MPDDARRRLAASIYDQLRDGIAGGRIRPGDPLPPSRQLARELGVSRHTITTVYGRLVAEGLLEGAAGGGTRVAMASHPNPGGHVPSAHRASGSAVSARPAAAALLTTDRRTSVRFDLRLGVPDPALFPLDDWRRRLARELRAPDLTPGRLGDPAGEPELRAAVAAWISLSRGVSAGTEQVVVTAGAQQGFELVLGALIGPGDVVAVEDPGYPPFRDLARLRGARVVGVPVDDEGLVVDAVPAAARLVHVTPSHQFPLGTVMSLRRRRALLEWARRHDAVIVEDDYDSEFRSMARPLEPLYRLDTDGRVIYAATFSKILSPLLRLGFLIAPTSLVPALAAVRQLVDRHGDPFGQLALARFLADGSMARHLHRARRSYAARRDIVVAGVEGLGRLVPSVAGLHVSIEVADAETEAAVLGRAQRRGVGLDGLGKYAFTAVRPGFAVSYGIESGDRLASALTALSVDRPLGRR